MSIHVPFMALMHHTPGPWAVGIKNRIQAGNLVLIGEREISARLHDDLNAHSKEQAANARLIAAAPDLLEACMAFYVWLQAPALDCATLNQMQELASRAIAKAELAGL